MSSAPESPIESLAVRTDHALAKRLRLASLLAFAAPLLTITALRAVLGSALWQRGVAEGMVAVAWPVCVVLLCASIAARLFTPASAGSVASAPGGIVLRRGKRQRFISEKAIRCGMATFDPASPDKRSVELDLTSGERVSIATTAASAPTILAWVRADAEHRQLRVVLGPTWRRWLLGFVYWYVSVLIVLVTMLCASAVHAVSTSGPGELLIFGLGTLLYYHWGRSKLPPTVVIGLDGVAIERGSKRRFIPLSDIAGVQAGLGSLVIAVVDGTHERLDVGEDRRNVLLAALHQRLLHVLAIAPKRGAAELDTSLLARDGRPARAWRSALLELVKPRSAYRAAPLSREHIERVLDDSESPVQQRLGAAIALVASGDERAKERVRLVASASANENVRVAFSQIVDDDADEASIEAASARSVRQPDTPARRLLASTPPGRSRY